METSKIFKVIGVIFAIGGALLGIILGKIQPMTSMETNSLGQIATKIGYNYPLMFYIWAAAAVISIFIFAIAVHLQNQEEIIYRLNSFNFNQKN